MQQKLLSITWLYGLISNVYSFILIYASTRKANIHVQLKEKRDMGIRKVIVQKKSHSINLLKASK